MEEPYVKICCDSSYAMMKETVGHRSIEQCGNNAAVHNPVESLQYPVRLYACVNGTVIVKDETEIERTRVSLPAEQTGTVTVPGASWRRRVALSGLPASPRCVVI
jgi:hypothetical protein